MPRPLSASEIARIPGCPPTDAEDCAIQALRDLSPEQAWSLLGLESSMDGIVIAGATGRLVLSGTRMEFVPARSFTSMAAGVADAAFAAARRAVEGEAILAGPEVVKKRLELCRSCMHYLAAEKRCGACRCFTELKTRLAASACPLSHWD